MDRDMQVTLTGPAKVAGRYEPAGKTLTVSSTLALQLAASGALDPTTAEALANAARKAAEAFSETPGLQDVASEVAAALADRDANWATAFDHFQSMAEARYEAAIADLTDRLSSDQQALKAENDRLSLDLSRANDLVATLTADLAAEARARADLEGKLAAVGDQAGTGRPKKSSSDKG